MSKTAEAIERVLKEGVSEGQKQTGVPVPPLTKEQREKAAVKVSLLFFSFSYVLVSLVTNIKQDSEHLWS